MQDGEQKIRIYATFRDIQGDEETIRREIKKRNVKNIMCGIQSVLKNCVRYQFDANMMLQVVAEQKVLTQVRLRIGHRTYIQSFGKNLFRLVQDGRDIGSLNLQEACTLMCTEPLLRQACRKPFQELRALIAEFPQERLPEMKQNFIKMEEDCSDDSAIGEELVQMEEGGLGTNRMTMTELVQVAAPSRGVSPRPQQQARAATPLRQRPDNYPSSVNSPQVGPLFGQEDDGDDEEEEKWPGANRGAPRPPTPPRTRPQTRSQTQARPRPQTQPRPRPQNPPSAEALGMSQKDYDAACFLIRMEEAKGEERLVWEQLHANYIGKNKELPHPDDAYGGEDWKAAWYGAAYYQANEALSESSVPLVPRDPRSLPEYDDWTREFGHFSDAE